MNKIIPAQLSSFVNDRNDVNLRPARVKYDPPGVGCDLPKSRIGNFGHLTAKARR